MTLVTMEHINHLLLNASNKGDLESVMDHHRNGANVNAMSGLAVQLASSNRYLEVVKYLHINGANIHADNDCALRSAAIYGSLEVVKYLHINGANINAGDDHALRWAAFNNRLEIVKYLLQNGAQINYSNKDACFVNSDGVFTIKTKYGSRILQQEIQTELCNFSNKIVRTKSVITKKMI